MKTNVKYIVLKSKDYQLGTSLFEENLDVDQHYFDQMPEIFSYQSHQFKVVSKELNRKQVMEDFEESQQIIVKVVAVEP